MTPSERRFWYSLGIVNGALEDPEMFSHVRAMLAEADAGDGETRLQMERCIKNLVRVAGLSQPWEIAEK
jgi:hypothetical protein